MRAGREELNYTREQLENANRVAYEVPRSLREQATRYLVWGGGGALTGAFAGLAWSLLSEKQRKNKLRNTLMGLGIGALVGGGAAAIGNAKWNPDDDLFDFESDLIH